MQKTSKEIGALNEPVILFTSLHLHIRALFSALWVRRWWIIVTAAIVTAGMWTYAKLATPVYRSSVTVMGADSSQGLGGGALGSALSQFGGIASLAGLAVGGGNRELEEAVAVLNSREFTQNFVERNGLRPKLYAEQWDAVKGDWKLKEEEPTPASAYGYFDHDIRQVARDRRSGLITVTVEWTDRFEAALWANELIRQVNEQMRVRAIADADAYVKYLEKEFAATSFVATREAISRLIEAHIKRRMVATVSPEFAFRVVDTALPSDEDSPIRPRKFLLFVGGPVVGVFLGVFLVLSYYLVFGYSGKKMPKR